MIEIGKNCDDNNENRRMTMFIGIASEWLWILKNVDF